MSELSHLDDEGRARMVDVSDKPVTARTATAEGRLICAAETVALVREGRTPKGAVIARPNWPASWRPSRRHL